MDFTTPIAFVLLLLIPYFVWLGRPGDGASRWRERISLGLRLLIFLMLILSLAGTRIVRAADDLAIVFLLDASDSIDQEAFDRAETFIRHSIEGMAPNDQAAVILFGSDALVDRPMSRLAELAPIRTVPTSLQTDIAEAVRLGLALFPSGSARRIVLMSDGTATTGDAEKAAQLASASNVQIDVIPLAKRADEAEALLTAVDAPARVREGESFSVNVTADSNRDMTANLRVLSGNDVVFNQDVQLRLGINNFTIPLRATIQEFARYVVQLTPATDTYYQNNQLAAFTDIVGPPRVLLVSQGQYIDERGSFFPDESPQLRLALQATGLLVDEVKPDDLSSNLAELSNYDSIILVNVNAKNLSPRKMEALEQYVRDLGGGVVAVGGPQSYGMGGYYRTPLEALLPVDMQIKDQERFPSVSMVLVIDRSGSMAAQEGGLTKIQLAAEGATRVVELLNDFDEITIIPVDTAPDNPIGPALAADRGDIIGQIRQIGAGGGGIYVRTGLEAATEALSQSSNQIKHIILLADGADSEQKEGVPELIDALVEEGVTVSTVSIGEGHDVPWLQEMAELGGGRFHFTNRAANLPQIFTQETMAIQRSYLVEERFFPELNTSGFASRHAIFRSMESSGISRVPPLFGYVGTAPKQTSQTILESHMGDPLLAAWEYGLGRSVAWTSDATGRWGRSWVSWDGFPTFWSNLVRWTISEGRGSELESGVTLDGDRVRITVDAQDDDGHYLNNLNISALVLNPQGESDELELQQVGPGQYESTFSPGSEGAYLIRLGGSTEMDEPVAGQTIGWVLDYSPEYRQLEPDNFLLARMAELTSGRVIALDPEDGDPAEIFLHDIEGQAAARPIWPWLLVVAAVLLPFDIAVRRLALTRKDLDLAWAATLGRWRPKREVTRTQPRPVARLFEAKERAREQARTPVRASDPVSQEASPETEVQPLRSSGEEPREVAPAKEKPPIPKPSREEEEGGETLASRLLKQRRRRDDDEEEQDQ
jgi:uncharacterized membrane protein